VEFFILYKGGGWVFFSLERGWDFFCCSKDLKKIWVSTEKYYIFPAGLLEVVLGEWMDLFFFEVVLKNKGILRLKYKVFFGHQVRFLV